MLLKEFELEFETLDEGGKTTAIIVAAGSSSRMNGTDKQLAKLSNIPVIIRSIMAFENVAEIDNIVVVTREDIVLKIQNLVSEYNLKKVTDIIAGGSSRAQSVINGIAEVRDSDFVLIHDGARPLVSTEIINNTLSAAKMYGAAIPVVPVKDTVKIIDTSGKVKNTPDRKILMAVQTPQCFKMSVITDAIAKNAQNLDTITDDSLFVENAGGSVYTVDGSYENIKITTKEDLNFAENILNSREGG